MKLDFAFICDYAEVAGKISALGVGFDTIYAANIPAKHPQFFLVMQLRASVTEAGDKGLEVHLIDEDGADIIPAARARFAIQRPSQGTQSIGRVALALRNVEFPRYGSYSLHALIDGHEIVEVPLRVSPPPRAR